ncbi:MAG: hypothetical protein CME88_13465 [Hirschia sp.]|nr:hypothetical protein [Hirschia sp.]MBF19379.1 hypothetical protein [Hirschia sp.]
MKRSVQLVLALFFAVAGVLHFYLDDVFANIVPPVLPFPIAIVWITGVMELGFALGLMLTYRLSVTGLLLGLYLLAVLPANVYMAMAGIPLGQIELGAGVLWGRVALQFPLIALVLWATGAPPFRSR